MISSSLYLRCQAAAGPGEIVHMAKRQQVTICSHEQARFQWWPRIGYASLVGKRPAARGFGYSAATR